jgi:hypothetical protein
LWRGGLRGAAVAACSCTAASEHCCCSALLLPRSRICAVAACMFWQVCRLTCQRSPGDPGHDHVLVLLLCIPTEVGTTHLRVPLRHGSDRSLLLISGWHDCDMLLTSLYRDNVRIFVILHFLFCLNVVSARLSMHCAIRDVLGASGLTSHRVLRGSLNVIHPLLANRFG